MEAKTDWLQLCVFLFANYISREHFNSPNRVVFNLLNEHIDSVAQIALSESSNKQTLENVEKLFFWNGVCGHKLGLYEYALEHLLINFNLSEHLFENNNNKYFDVCRKIAHVYIDIGNSKEAQYWLDKTPNSVSAYHSDVGAKDYADQNWNDALDEYFSALVLCDNDIQRGIISNNIALIYLNGKREWFSAMQYFQPAMTLIKRNDVDDELKTKLFNTLAAIYAVKGDFQDALDIYEHVLIIREAILGENHPDVARIYQNIGGVYAEQNDVTSSVEYWVKAAKIYISVSGRNNIHTRQCINNIKSILIQSGNIETLGDILRDLEVQE